MLQNQSLFSKNQMQEYSFARTIIREEDARFDQVKM